MYPGIAIDRETFVASGCVVTCSDESRMELRGAHLARNVVLKADAGGHLRIGRSFVGPGSMVVAAHAVVIGNLCQLAEYVVVRDHDHLADGMTRLDAQRFVTAPVTIGERVWIGAKATVLRGVEVGDDAVIGAHAVVTRPVPRGERWVGVPARPLPGPKSGIVPGGPVRPTNGT